MIKKETKMGVKVKLNIKDAKITLSLEEVKELAKILEGIVGKETQYIPYYPYVEPCRPWRWDYWDTDPYSPTVIWGDCDSTTTSSTYSVSLKN